jgi:hypothetical protein
VQLVRRRRRAPPRPVHSHPSSLTFCTPTAAPGWQALKQEDLVLWGKDMASQIRGPAEASSSPGAQIFATASVCWGGDEPSRCTAEQMKRASNEVPPDEPAPPLPCPRS